jgi:hypothetical protein
MHSGHVSAQPPSLEIRNSLNETFPAATALTIVSCAALWFEVGGSVASSDMLARKAAATNANGERLGDGPPLRPADRVATPTTHFARRHKTERIHQD